MKKLLFGLLICLFIVGCGKTNYENIMEELATTFYNDYIKVNPSLTNPTVSISDLKSVDMDVSKLKNCAEASYTEIIINSTTREIESFKHHLDCK